MEESIELYRTQLLQVEEALAGSKDATEVESLRSLKADLEELIDLTRQTMAQQNVESSTSAPRASILDTINSNSNSMDDEMAIFLSEIRSLGSTVDAASTADSESEEKFDAKLKAIKDELQAMVGKKCSAPHNHSWGARAYHNAIICGVDDTRDYDLKNIKDFRLRVLFTNPTHKEMIPCGYYLDGDCKFDVDKCRFSHGELVAFGELKDYREPEFDKLRKNCAVLAKMNDKMWHKGRVLSVDFTDKTCRVKLDTKKKDEDFDFEHLLPIVDGEDDDDTSSGSSDSEDEEDIAALRNAYLIEKALMTPALNQALGEWEKYTKGIGSKLMQKMGYVVGCGLGSRGEGIVVPISAQILPPGRSLDHCMELREAANGDKNLFSVERKLDTQKKKQDVINAKNYERAKKKTDIFSFLNDNILATNPESSANQLKTNKSMERNAYKNHSIKNLNVESLKIAEDIRRKEREIERLKDSMRRHTSGSDVYNKINGQLAAKNHELSSLRKSECSVAREQQLRKHKDKMAVF